MALSVTPPFGEGSRCLVINRLSTTRGPMESGVTCLLPSPTTSMLSHPSVRSLSLSPSSSFNCSFIVSSGSFRCRLSIVIYLPFAFFRFFSPASLITSIVVVLILLSSFTTVFTRTPSISVFPPALSLSSIARSVRISLFMIILLIFDFTVAIISLFIRKFICRPHD